MNLHATQKYVQGRPGAWRSMVKIYEKIVPLTGAPHSILIDDMVELGPWGLVATTYRHANFGWVVEKPDGNGGWVPTLSSYGFPGVVDDPPGYGFTCDIYTSPMPRPKLPGGETQEPSPYADRYIGSDPGRDWWQQGSTLFPYSRGLEGLGFAPEDQITRARVLARRNAHAPTPEEAAIIDGYGYRLRVVIHAINLVVWEKEVPIPAAGESPTFIIDEDIDLNEYGMVSDSSQLCFIAEFRRNGKTLRTYKQREYMTGEEFDPPAPPVTLSTIGVFPGNDWRNNNNNTPYWPVSQMYGNSFGVGIYSDYDGLGGAYRWSSGVWANTDFGHCAESVKQILHVAVWRNGPLIPTYYDGTVATQEFNMEDIVPGMGITFIARSGFPDIRYATFIPDGPLERSYTYTYDPPILRNTFVEVVWNGIKIHYTPGVSTLQDVSDALSACIASDSRSDITVGTLSTPAYVLTQTEAFQYGATPTPTPVAVSAEDNNNCTIRLRMLIAPPNRRFEYPFADSGDFTYRMLPLDIVPVVRSTFIPNGIWSDGQNIRFSTATLAKSKDVPYYTSPETVGDGTPQPFEHGFTLPEGMNPASLRRQVIPVKWNAGAAFDYSTTATGKHVFVTATPGVSYIVMVWAPQ